MITLRETINDRPPAAIPDSLFPAVYFPWASRVWTHFFDGALTPTQRDDLLRGGRIRLHQMVIAQQKPFRSE